MAVALTFLIAPVSLAHKEVKRIVPACGGAQEPPSGIVQTFGPGERDTIAIYPQADGTVYEVPTPYVLSAGGNTLNFGTELYGIYKQCAVGMPINTPNTWGSWLGGYAIGNCATGKFAGNFLPGTKVLVQFYPVPIDITFANPVSDVGFEAEVIWWHWQAFQLTAFNGSTELGTIIVGGNGVSLSAPAADGLAPWVGVHATCGNVITRVQVIMTQGYEWGFGIGPVSFGSYSVAIPSIPPTQ
jgi:hypothetical protein